METKPCCREGLKIEYFERLDGTEIRRTDRICPQHPDLGAKTRAKAWVKSALHMAENGQIKEARKLFLDA